jgi:phosphoribosylformimino-5-aminoimidazole carboxamide ribotide isomerase
MGKLKLYPAMDLLGGECVRLAQGRFEDKTVYSSNPLEIAAGFQADGAQAMHIVDLEGAKDPARRQVALLRELLKSIEIEVQVGGGIRSLRDAAELVELGADRVVIGSLAVQQPEVTESIIGALGAGRVTLALDLAVGKDFVARVAIKGWQESSALTLEDVLERYRALGVSHLLCTDIQRDGMLTGPALELYRGLRQAYPEMEIQASGGIRDLRDLNELQNANVPAAILGRSIYAGTLNLKEALASC